MRLFYQAPSTETELTACKGQLDAEARKHLRGWPFMYPGNMRSWRHIPSGELFLSCAHPRITADVVEAINAATDLKLICRDDFDDFERVVDDKDGYP